MRIPGLLWWAAVALCLVGALAAALRDLPFAAVVFLGAAAVFAAIGWRQRGPAPHTPYSPALVAPERAVVFWKDGCPPCHRLLRAMGGDPRVTWVNVFRDSAGDVRVRELNGGDQLTPTALIGTRVMPNPSAAQLRTALDAAAGAPRAGNGPAA